MIGSGELVPHSQAWSLVVLPIAVMPWGLPVKTEGVWRTGLQKSVRPGTPRGPVTRLAVTAPLLVLEGRCCQATWRPPMVFKLLDQNVLASGTEHKLRPSVTRRCLPRVPL